MKRKSRRPRLDQDADLQDLSGLQKPLARNAGDLNQSQDERTEAELLRLQRSAGNEAVTSLLSESPGSVPAGLRPFDGQFPVPPIEPLLADSMKNSGPGAPLGGQERERAENSLGRDLSRVRVHTDEGAGRLTGMLGAAAATTGSDIYLSSAIQQGTSDGDRVLSHELGHVAQTRGLAGTGGLVSVPHSQQEREADNIGLAVQRGERAPAAAEAAYPGIQLYQPFPQGAAQKVLHLDSGPIVGWCKDIGNAGTDGLWESSGLEAEVEDVIDGPYFGQRGHGSWTSNEHTVERGLLEPDYKVRVHIRLLIDDNPITKGPGAGADLSSKGSHETSHETSSESSSSVKAGGEAGGEKGGKASAEVGSESKHGKSDKQETGGDIGAESKSTTVLYGTKVYAVVKLTKQPVIFLMHPSAYTLESPEYLIGYGRYTMPTLEAPVGAAAHGD